MEKTILICLSLIFTTGLCYFDDGLLPPGPVYGAVGERVLFNTIITPLPTPLLVVVWNFNTAYGIIVSDTTGLCQGQGGLFPPGPVYGTAGENVLFTSTITPSSTPLLALSWTFNGVNNIIRYDSSGNTTGPAYRDRVSVNIYTGTLQLRDLTLDDSGSYQLVTVTTDGVIQQDQTTLDVFERISGVSLTGPTESLIEDQSSAVLTCAGTGSIITTEWMKDDQPLSPSNNIIFSADNRSVSISPVRRSDSGEYHCRVSTSVSSDTATYTMTVHYGPENVSISGQNEVEVGSKVTLTCSAESTPPASFIWMLNGRETGETTASYSIEKIDSTHSGNYTCTAWNSVTSLNTTVHHHLTIKSKVSP
ncbi:carcinoembryonic antigen-related cell adhesion molecule 5-like [Chanos chanos]|uniref:Carcinoembryonic antigen-related cell adhesion molecule 5-like n=1 Tax=Chanos chanos TaxID=29144 RepID=A0A6J2WAT3_CHACN|nr:carcinoembryonic antigen-related cell adhesion molecule 5-like [Chanos chanos]